MDALEFKKLLFKTAFCCIACDGHIDDMEIKEMHKLDRDTSYFGDVDLSDELNALIEDLKQNGTRVISNLFKEIQENEINPVQELLLLEITMRLIYADEQIKENELKFLRLLRSKLEVFDEIIIERFGRKNLLFDKDNAKSIITEAELAEGIKLPEMKEFENLSISFNAEDFKVE